jgi:dephospho-CoA kinase
MIFEEITEDILNEKLITYGNRKPYGQIVFIAGGAGSGKGFAIDNFLDSSSFKVRDVDEMKKQLQILNRIGKITIKDILAKYGRNIKLKDLDLIRKVEKDGYRLQNLDLKNPDHVYVLHILVKAMGIKEKTLEKLLAGKNNPEVLPNIMFDITAKDVTDITSVVPMLKEAGYKSENIHLTWVLTNYVTAMVNNKSRSRMVPEDILLKTHEGASNTVWGLVTKALPKGMNGRVDVILNNPEHTVFYTDADGRTINGKVKGFLSLPLKKAGGGIFAEKLWKDKLFNWIKDNAPESITANMKESVNENAVDKLRTAVQKINQKYQVKVSTHPVTKGQIEIILGRGNHPNSVYHSIEKLVSKLGIKGGDYSIFDESVNEESSEETLRGLREMAMGDLERIADYADMILDRMNEGQELESWMYSQITLSVDQLNSVHDAMDGNDGVIEQTIKERINLFVEENEPTNPDLWDRAIAAAKRKYDVYPSAYANAFASKWYGDKGGKWRTKKD